MTRTKFKDDHTDHQNYQTKYTVKGAQDMTIEELIESIRGKIQYVQKQNSSKNKVRGRR